MKCPKCDYLGFDTGPRCKNCGYDFSLMAAPAADVELVRPRDRAVPDELWFDQVDRALGIAQGVSGAVPSATGVGEPADRTPASLGTLASRPVEPALPFFVPPGHGEVDERPLVPFPVAPRPPLAVRKTPEVPRLRAVSRTPRPPADPVLEFLEDPVPDPELQHAAIATSDFASIAAPAVATTRRGRAVRPNVVSSSAPPSPAVNRLQALALDHLVLLSIDAVVVYLTLRMAALDIASWGVLPAGPLVAFLFLIKFAYFTAFTAVGGQTIGKMALHIRVVGHDDAPVDTACAIRRTLAGVLSSVAFGLGFIPALIGEERRALHDRMARTRVIALSTP